MPGNEEQHARWATDRELRNAGWCDPSGWPLGDMASGPVYFPREAQQENAIALAPPGSGKSRGILVPAIRSEANHAVESRRSLIVVDPAGEIYRLTVDAVRKTHRILVWNPADPGYTNVNFDPLAYLGTPSDQTFVTRCGQAAAIWYTATGGNVGQDSFWDTQPIMVLTALIIARASEQPSLTLADLVDFVALRSIEELRDAVLESGHKAAKLRAAAITDVIQNERAAGVIFGELRRRLLLAANPTVIQTMGRPSLNIHDFVSVPTVLYLQVGAGDQELQPLLSVAVSLIMSELPRLSIAGRPLTREIRIIIDELANIGKLYALASAINTLRKYHIGFLLATQTRARLYAVYGKDEATAIIEGCKTRFALGGLAQEDAEWVSSGLGMAEWETTDKDHSLAVFHARLPGYHLAGGGGSVILPNLPVPYRRTHKHTRRQKGPLLAAHEITAMYHAMVVLPSYPRPFPCALRLYTGE